MRRAAVVAAAAAVLRAADRSQMAKEGQMGAVKIMAKDLVRTRNYITKATSTLVAVVAVVPSPRRRESASGGWH